MAETDKPKKQIGCFTLFIIFGGLFALWVIYNRSEDRASSTLAARSCRWVDVDSFKGQGMKTTDTFTITGQKWRVKWSFGATQYSKENAGAGAIFQVFVYDENGIPVELAANLANQVSASDESIFHNTGTYYLTISSANVSYVVDLEECK